jgi:hypothetical protein
MPTAKKTYVVRTVGSSSPVEVTAERLKLEGGQHIFLDGEDIVATFINVTDCHPKQD